MSSFKLLLVLLLLVALSFTSNALSIAKMMRGAKADAMTELERSQKIDVEMNILNGLSEHSNQFDYYFDDNDLY